MHSEAESMKTDQDRELDSHRAGTELGTPGPDLFPQLFHHKQEKESRTNSHPYFKWGQSGARQEQ